MTFRVFVLHIPTFPYPSKLQVDLTYDSSDELYLPYSRPVGPSNIDLSQPYSFCLSHDPTVLAKPPFINTWLRVFRHFYAELVFVDDLRPSQCTEPHESFRGAGKLPFYQLLSRLSVSLFALLHCRVIEIFMKVFRGGF